MNDIEVMMVGWLRTVLIHSPESNCKWIMHRIILLKSHHWKIWKIYDTQYPMGEKGDLGGRWGRGDVDLGGEETAHKVIFKHPHSSYFSPRPVPFLIPYYFQYLQPFNYQLSILRCSCFNLTLYSSRESNFTIGLRPSLSSSDTCKVRC